MILSNVSMGESCRIYTNIYHKIHMDQTISTCRIIVFCALVLYLEYFVCLKCRPMYYFLFTEGWSSLFLMVTHKYLVLSVILKSWVLIWYWDFGPVVVNVFFTYLGGISQPTYFPIRLGCHNHFGGFKRFQDGSQQENHS